MRFLLTLAACAALTVSAFAQNGAPREVTATTTVSMRVGQTKTFRVDRTIVSVGNTSPESVKTTTSLSDQEFFVEGIGPGDALITIGYNDGTFYRMNVNVGGRTVRIYGNERRAKTAAHFFCTGTECTRAKPDTDKRTPSSESVATTGRDEDGNTVTTTRTY
jgi:hypothetical protein